MAEELLKELSEGIGANLFEDLSCENEQKASKTISERLFNARSANYIDPTSHQSVLNIALYSRA